MSRLQHFLRPSRAERQLLLEAVLVVSLAGLAVRTVQLRWFIRLAGEPQTEMPSVAEPQYTVQVYRVGWAVHTVVRYTGGPGHWQYQVIATFGGKTA